MPLIFVRDEIVNSARRVDAIVNTTNAQMFGYGRSVDGAIHRAAGPALDRECEKLVPLLPGTAVTTGAFDIPCRCIIHTVGPDIRGPEPSKTEINLLKNCYRSCLEEAKEQGCRSVAFPLISAGTYGFPPPRAMEIAGEEILKFLSEEGNDEMRVEMVLYGKNEFILSRPLQEKVDRYLAEHLQGAEARPSMASEACYGAAMPRVEACPKMAARASRPVKHKKMLPDEEAIMAPEEEDTIRFSLSHRERKLSVDELSFNGLEEGTIKPVLDESFTEMLHRKVEASGRKNSDIYNAAQVSKAVFSKVWNGQTAQPKKTTVLALALALQLGMEELREMTEKAGYSFTKSSMLDVIVMCCVENRIYDVMRVNEILFTYDQPLLGNI